MNICSQHDSRIIYESDTCSACQKINELSKLLVAYESELADYGRTVTRLNKENKELRADE